MSIPSLHKRIEELENDVGRGETHIIRMVWENGELVADWLMKGESFVRVIPENDSHLMTNIKGD